MASRLDRAVPRHDPGSLRMAPRAFGGAVAGSRAESPNDGAGIRSARRSVRLH